MRTSIHDTMAMKSSRSRLAGYVVAYDSGEPKDVKASSCCGERSSPETPEIKTRRRWIGAANRMNRTFDFGRWMRWVLMGPMNVLWERSITLSALCVLWGSIVSVEARLFGHR